MEAKSENRLSENQPLASLNFPVFGDLRQSPAFTWLLVYKQQSNKDQGKKLVHFLWWMMHEGQQAAPVLHFVPLPKEVVAREEQALTEITYEGQPLLAKK